MKNYKRILYGISAIAALGGGVHTYNVSHDMNNLMKARNTPAVQQIENLEHSIYAHSKNPLNGDLQGIANKYQELGKLRGDKESQKEFREYGDAYDSWTNYALISGSLITLSLLLGGLATGKVRFGETGGKENE